MSSGCASETAQPDSSVDGGRRSARVRAAGGSAPSAPLDRLGTRL